MEHSPGMGMGERVEHRQEDRLEVGPVEAPSSGREGAPSEMFHSQVGRVWSDAVVRSKRALRGHSAVIVDPYDVGVVKGRDRLNLSPECGDPLLVLCEWPTQYLDCEFWAGVAAVAMGRAPHSPTGAGTDLFD